MNAQVEAWRSNAAELAAAFAASAAKADEADEFVAQNYAALRASGLLAAAVPAELGGYGLELPELCEMLRSFARGCASTALAFSMHTHQVALAAWRWRHEKAPVEPLLEKIVRERIVVVSTGGGDWLDSSGEARPDAGGFRVKLRKPFASGVPAGDLLITSAVVAAGEGRAEVIHFAVPLKSAGVRIEPTWRTMGMRGTASHDVVLDDVLVPQSAVSARRPQGAWHPLFHLTSMIALPLIYSVYVGVAEAARERALALVRRRRPDEHLAQLVGEMENQLAAARILHADWVALGQRSQPGPQTTSESLVRRTLVARAVLGTVDTAMNVAGGAAFFRANGLERLFRDAQGARYHPMPEGLQKALTGKLALGQPI